MYQSFVNTTTHGPAIEETHLVLLGSTTCSVLRVGLQHKLSVSSSGLKTSEIVPHVVSRSRLRSSNKPFECFKEQVERLSGAGLVRFP